MLTILLTILSAAAAYWFTKQREREAEIRKEKLEHYKDFASALCGIERSICTPEAKRVFVRSCTKIQLVAPQSVIDALHDFQNAIRVGHVLSKECHDRLLTKLFIEMRRDLHVNPRDDVKTLEILVWGSGEPLDSEKEGEEASNKKDAENQ